MEKIDTSMDGFKYAGINLTEKQYEDITALNLQMQLHQEIPAFNVLMLLKTLGILPQEMLSDCGESYSEGSEQWFQRRYGKRKEGMSV